MINLFTRSLYLILIVFIFIPSSQGAKKATPLSFGPTGILGHALPKWPKQADAIHVTNCEKGSPAFGKLKNGDVIIGVGKAKFTEHPLGALAKIIDSCEGKGEKLTLLLKGGKQVVIKLPSLGTYSSTAPYNCLKSNKIIEQAAKQLMKEKGLGSTPTRTGLLGLLATGEPKHLEVVKKFIRTSGMADIGLTNIVEYLETGKVPTGFTGWTWGYNLIVLGEYYLLTKDEKVLPAIKTYAMALAKGQDAVGLWGHRVANAKKRAPGYGIMNQPSLTNFMGMLLAKKCGIQNPILEDALKKTNAYVVDHVGKGGFPYGVHGPAENQFNNNGSSASAAICMALTGNRKGAAYFSRVSAPTHNKLTLGHASHFFNPLWTPLGASLSGPELTQKFFKSSLWYFNSKRHWSGGFPGRGRSGFFAGQALLMYCLPRKVLFITGREADKSIWLKGKEVDKIMMMSQIDYAGKSSDELLQMFNNPFGQVRINVTGRLSHRLNKIWHASNKKKKTDAITPRLLALIKNGNENEKITALDCLGKSSPYVAKPNTKFIAGVMNNKNESLAVRVAAASALGKGNCRESALPYYNDMLRLVLEKRSEPDPFGHVDNKLSSALIGMLIPLKKPESRKSLVVDRALLYRVAEKFLNHKRQKVRGAGTSLLKGIKIKDFHIVADKLLHVLKNQDPSYHTYSSALNADGIKILAKLNIKEGLDLLEQGIFHGGGKWAFRYRSLMASLPDYGANAKPYIAKFEAHKSINKKGGRFASAWKKVVQKINKDNNPKKLITVEEAKQMGKQ
jgi:hypothetical protein